MQPELRKRPAKIEKYAMLSYCTKKVDACVRFYFLKPCTMEWSSSYSNSFSSSLREHSKRVNCAVMTIQQRDQPTFAQVAALSI
jgi:hypothetical protein